MKNCGKYLGMVIILVATISIGSSYQAVMDGATKYLDEIKEKNIQEDGFFETEGVVSYENDSFYENNAIKVYENFYVTDAAFRNDSKVIVFNERTQIDIPIIFEGSLPTSAGEVALDHVFAANQGICVGDRVTILGQSFEVSGTVSMPDYTALFMNNTDIIMNALHFGVAVVDSDAFDDFGEDSITHRYSYYLEDRSLDVSQKADIAEDMMRHIAMSGKEIKNFIRSDQNQSISFLEMDMGKDEPFVNVFVYILVALIAFVFAILTNNTIDRESVVIGTLLASGYKKSEILWHYLQPTLIVAFTGSVIGNILGYTVMIEPFIDMYYTSYSIGPIVIEFSPSAFITTTVLPVIIMVAINSLMLRLKLSLSPLKFLRHDLKKGRQKRAVKLPHFSFPVRFRIRVILQNKWSYLMLFLGVFLASFLLMFGIGLSPLMDHYTESVDESLKFNHQYFLKAPIEKDDAEKMYVYDMDTWFALGKKNISVQLMGVSDESYYFGDAIPKSGVAVSSALANKLNLKVGDKIRLKDTVEDKRYQLRIGKIYPYNASMAVFMERSKLNELLDNSEDDFNCLLSENELDIDDKYLAKEISRSDMMGAASQMMESFSTVILFINVFSVVVYMILMYILTRVVIDKNALAISFMKVFGYEKNEIRGLFLNATTFIVAASLFVCIPVEIALFKTILVILSSMIEGYIEFYLPQSVYIKIIVIGFVAYFAINALHVRGIGRIPMTDALKNRE